MLSNIDAGTTKTSKEFGKGSIKKISKDENKIWSKKAGKHKSVVNEHINLRSVLGLNIRDCLCKIYPLIFVSDIILPETLATERLYQG